MTMPMYKAVFQNSKIALIFAAMTLFSAVSMVGTSDDAGLLTKIASLSSSKDGDLESPAPGEGQAPAAKTSIFGAYVAGDNTAATAPEAPDAPDALRVDEPIHLK